MTCMFLRHWMAVTGKGEGRCIRQRTELEEKMRAH